MLVAITGGIGCGKSVVSQLLRTMGFVVYDCDVRTKELLLHDEKLRRKMTELFGEDTYLPDGSLNKPMISGKLFGNEEMLTQINCVIHPAVADDLLRQQEDYFKNKKASARNGEKDFSSSVFFFESAILFESRFDRLLSPDAIISVTAPKDVCIERVINRDKISRERVLSRINSQISQEEKDERADFVIINDGRHSVIAQTEKIIEELKNFYDKEK